MFNTNTARTRTSSLMRLKHSGRRVAIVDEHIPDRYIFFLMWKQNHWAEVCRSRQEPQMVSTSHRPTTKQQPRNLHSVIEIPSTSCDDPKKLYFSPVTVSTVTRDEALTHIILQLPTHPLNTACMRVTVDIGAQGNVLPFRVLVVCFRNTWITISPRLVY